MPVAVRAAPGSTWTGVVVFLYGTLCALFVAFFLYRSQSLVETTIDLNGLGLLSRNLAAGEGFTLGQGPTIRRAPLYPLLGAALLKGFSHAAPSIGGAGLYRPIIIGNCILFGLTCVTVWVTTRRIFGSRAALLAAVLCPIVPQSLRYVGMTEVETLMGLLLALLAFTGLNLVERPRLATGIWFGVTAAASTLTKPVTLLYPFLFVLLFVLDALRRGRVLRGRTMVALLAALVSFAGPLLPWVIRNMVVTEGLFVGISSNAPGEFLRGYVNVQPKYYLLRQDFGGAGPSPQKWDPEANDYEERLLSEHGARFFRYNFDRTGRMIASPDPGDVPGWQIEAQKDRIELEEVKRRLLREPVEFLRKFIIQLATFWYIVETRTKSVLVGTVALVFLVLAALGVVHARSRNALVWPVVSVVVYINLFYAAVLAFARYSMPLFPVLLILSSGGLELLISRITSDRGEPLEPTRRPAPPSAPGATIPARP